MASRSCVSGCGRFLTSSDGHDRCPSCLGFKHAEAALVDESCSHCGNMTMAMLRSRYLLARRGGIPLALPRSSSSGRRTTSAQGQGDLRITVRASPSSTSPRASHSSSTSHRLGFPDEYAGSSDRAGPSISFGAPADDELSITALGDELGSGEDDLAALPPSGRVALPESDPELTAMLSRAAESIGLHYRRPPSPERSRLDDWFLGAQAERRQPPPVPFFPEVHEEVTRSWKAPFSARNRPSASSVLTTLDGGAAQGYVGVPPVERAIAMQLCPQGAAAWRGNPRLPSRACKFSSALTAKAYGAAGQAASALHAITLLQVHQAKALKQLHEGDADPGVLQELRTATDLALRATKEQTLPYAEDLFSWHGVGLGQPHSTSLRGACSVNAEMPGVSPAQEGGSTETFSEAPGAYGILSRYHAARIASYETASALAPRPSPEVGMAPRHIPGLTHPVLPSHLQPMVGPCLSSGRSSPRASIQACCCFNRRLCHGLGGHVQRARSRGALDRAPAAVAYQLPRVAGSMACSAPLQNAATREAYTGPLGQHCDRCVHQPPGRSTLPSHVATRPPSPPLESEASEVASRRSCPRRAQSCSRRALTSARPSGRMATPPRGTPADLETLRGRSGRPVCLPGHVPLPVVFLPVRGDPRYGCAGMQLASGLTQICVSPSEPSRTDPVQGQGGRGASPLGGALLAQSDLVPRTNAPRDSPSLANSSEEGSTFSERGHPLAPAPRLVESPRMVLGRDAEVLSGLPPAVVNTITSARALSTRQAYRLKWNLFVNWCSPRREDPRRCPIAVVLSFLQDELERTLSPSTLKVYVAAIAAHHDAVDGKSLGKHDLVIRFLRGARRLNPPRPHLVPSWDLPSVLSALRGAPFEPLQSVELKFLSLKTVLLSALATVKRVGDLQAFSVDDSGLEFGPADSHVVLRPRPGYVPKVPTMPFRDQVVNLQALPREEADPAIALLCPVRALHIYVDRTQSFRTSDQLFVCFGGQQKGRAVSKQRLAHWIVEAIVLAYQARRLPCPLGVRAHSTRGVASSWALARGASIADICKAAGWATPNTFARFYNLRIEPVSSRVHLSRMASNTGTRSVSIMLAAPFPSTDRIRAPCCFSVSSPRQTLLKFLPHPRQSGVAEHQTPGPVLVRCPRSTLVLG